MKIPELHKCGCGGTPRFNNGTSQAFNNGKMERMRSCSISCRGCGVKTNGSPFYFDSEGGLEKAKKYAARKWNRLWRK